MIDLAIVLGCLGLLVFFAFRGITLILLAPVAALLAAGLTGGLPVLAAYTQIFMTNTGDFIVAFFPLFMLGAIFGKLMDDSGAAKSIARQVSHWLGPERSILSVVLCCGVLTYGGVSAFVVAFAIYPLAAELFRSSQIPKRLIPGTLALGAFTFTMTALPGTPAIQNAIPMPFFGTTAFAAPGLGIIAALVMMSLGVRWLQRRAVAAKRAGEAYAPAVQGSAAEPLEVDVVARERTQDEGFDIAELDLDSESGSERIGQPGLPPFAIAILPIFMVIVANFAFIEFVLPSWNTNYLAEPIFGATTIDALRGVWAVIAALFLAIVLLIATNLKRLSDLRSSLDKGTNASVLPIFNTASLVGFGGVIAALPVFAMVSEALINVGGENPLLAAATSVTVLSAITGSASGGMSIALDSLGSRFVEMANLSSVSLEAMHRVTTVASGALDALPHNGAVITLLSVCGVSHKEGYFDVFVVAVCIPMVALSLLLFFATFVGSF